MKQFMHAIGRPSIIVNLDPANENLPYEAAIDIMELITVQDAMDELKLGPNGALVYCMEYLEKNMEWLDNKLKPFSEMYLLFDFPGQVELYTHHKGMKSIVKHLEKMLTRICAVHLIDSHLCTDPCKFISGLMMSLSVMCNLEVPHVNVLSKVDMIEQYGNLKFSLQYYSDAVNLEYIIRYLNSDPFSHRFTELNKALCEMIEDYSLVSFQPLAISDKYSVHSLLKLIDKANGYIFGHRDMAKLPESSQNLLDMYASADFEYTSDEIQRIEESYTKRGKLVVDEYKQSPNETQLKVNDVATIVNLQNATQYNNLQCKLMHFINHEQRWAVRLLDSGTMIKVKSINLCLPDKTAPVVDASLSAQKQTNTDRLDINTNLKPFIYVKDVIEHEIS
jgi:hypothetical protein